MSPQEIIQKMYAQDAFSQWLGIEIMAMGEGFAELRMIVRPEMTNGFGIAHGGITYSLADSAFAFASNSHGRMSVSIETSISHTAPLRVGDVIVASANLESLSNRIGVYRIMVYKQATSLAAEATNEVVNSASPAVAPPLEVVAVFKGMVYRKDKEWV